MTPRKEHAWTTALTLAALAAGAEAQVTPTLVDPTTLNSLRPIGPVTAGSAYGRGALLDADGDSIADAFFLHGDEVEGVFGPGVYMSFYDGVASGVLDLAGLKDAAASGADALLTVGPGGLVQHEFAWNSGSPSWSDATLESSWAGAYRLESVRKGNQSWVFGAQSDQRTVRARAKIGGSAWSEATLFTTTFDITGIAAVDYNGNGVHELAVVGGSRWEVWRRPASSPLNPWILTASGSHPGYTLLDVAAGSQAANSADWFAMLASEDASPTASHVFTRTQSGSTGPEELDGQPDAIGLATGDIDENGDDDLVVSIRASADVLVALNQDSGASPLFDGNQSGAQPPTFTVAIGGTVFGNEAHPLVGDLDNDQDDDFCMPVSRIGGDDEFLVYRDPVYLPIDPGPVLVANSSNGLTVIDEDEGGGTCDDRVLITVDTSQANLPNNGNDFFVEAFLFSKADATASTNTMAQSKCSDSEEITAATSYGLDLILNSNPGCDGVCTGTGDTRDETIYFFLVCYTERTPAGDFVRRHQPRLLFFQTECDVGSSCSGADYLEDWRSSSLFDISSAGCGGQPNSTTPGFWTATGASLPCLPDLPPDMPPQLGNDCINANN